MKKAYKSKELIVIFLTILYFAGTYLAKIDLSENTTKWVSLGTLVVVGILRLFYTKEPIENPFSKPKE